jgi:hypothetical protein
LKNLGEADWPRQKQPKKRSLRVVNEHFEAVFNDGQTTQVVFQQPAGAGYRIRNRESAMTERNPIPLILTGVASIVGTIGVLWYYGYVHFAKPEDALLLSDFTMLKTIPGEDYKISLKPANQVAQCIDGVLVLFDLQQKGLTGVLVDNKKQAVRCMGQETPALEQ